MSLRSFEKQYARRRQTYRAVLDNPFTNEKSLWPHVKEQQHIWELIQTMLLARCKALVDAEVPLSEWPFRVITSFNDIVSRLQESGRNNESNKTPFLLLACNKDHGVPIIVMQQIPLLAYMSPYTVNPVQLPRGALPTIRANLNCDCSEGLLLAWGDELQLLIDEIAANVDERRLPWLDRLRFEPTSLKYLKTTTPMKKPVEKVRKK